MVVKTIWDDDSTLLQLVFVAKCNVKNIQNFNDVRKKIHVIS